MNRKPAENSQAATSGGALSLPKWIRVALVLAVLSLAAVIVSRAFADYDLADAIEALEAIPPMRILLAVLCAAGSYFCLTWFDWMAVRYAGEPLAYRRAALASFVSLSIGHNIGFAALSSGAVRYRFYSAWGLSVEQVAKVVLFCGATVGLGLAVTGGGAMLLRPGLAETLTGFQPASVLLLGGVCLAAALAYLLLAAFLRGNLRAWRWSFEMPSPRLAAGQVAAGAANYAFVSACLYQGLASTADIPFLAVAAAFVIANTTALLTHIPGGLGVIEGVMLLLLPHTQVIGALVIFRIVYFLLPLVIGGVLFLLIEGFGGNHKPDEA